ncbi:MAG TPA: hypothetical protein VHP14_14965 [Anaerolineales bacterium]|nr:hypothetical protein [Anaerolineales bacterium]
MENQSLLTLRPLRLGELLDRAIRLYRGNFLSYIGIIALVYVPLTVLQTAASALMSSSMLNRMSTPQDILANYGYSIGVLSTFILSFLQILLVQGIATGALTRAVADNYLGSKTGIADAYRGIRTSWFTLLGAILLFGIIIFVITLWWLVPCIGWVTGFGMIMFVTTAISPLLPPIVVLEHQGAFDAMRRAWSLARRRFWPLLGFVLVLYLFSLVIVNGPAIIANVLLMQVLDSLGNSSMQTVLLPVIQGLVSLIFVLLYLPLQVTALTLVYFDLRVRTEGLDLAILALQTSGSTDLSAALSAPVPSDERLVTWPEMGNFLILTLAGVGLYFFFFSFIMGIMLLFTSSFR